MMGRERGVKFYSEYDMSSGSHLQEAEAFFENWDENISNADINTILSAYNGAGWSWRYCGCC